MSVCYYDRDRECMGECSACARYTPYECDYCDETDNIYHIGDGYFCKDHLEKAVIRNGYEIKNKDVLIEFVESSQKIAQLYHDFLVDWYADCKVGDGYDD